MQQNDERITNNTAANDAGEIYIDEENGHERLAHQFAEYLMDRGYFYLARNHGADLYSTLTGKFHAFHAETNLYQQWLWKQPGCRNSGHNPLLHDILRQRIKYASAREFIPGGYRPLVYEADGVPVLNTWKPYEPQTEVDAGTDMPLWTEYLERLFPDADERHTVVQWLAHIFQRPEEKPSWHLMLTSATGTGKGFLFQQILSPLLNHQAALLNDYSKLTNQFSTVIANNLLVFLDDCRSSSKSLHTRLKSLLTERRQQIEEKQEQARMVSTYTRFILASNERRPIRFSPNERERRWFAVQFMEHRHNPEETGKFISRLSQWLMQDGSLDAVYWWLMAYDLTGFNPHHCRATETLEEMQEQSRSMLDIELSDWLESNRVFKMESLRLLFDAPADLIKHRLEELGFRQSRINTNGAGVDRSRYWFPADWKPKQAAKWLEDAADGTIEQF